MRKGSAVMVAVGMVALALAGWAWAQQAGSGGAGNGARDGSGPLVDLSRPVTVQGVVMAFQAGVGQGMPELVVRDAAGNDRVFVLGPYWFLQSQGFAAQSGDQVTVNGYACASCEHQVAVASVVNATRALTLTLRNSDGTPAWTGPRSAGLRKHLGGGASGVGATAAGTGTGICQGGGTGHGAGNGTCLGHRFCQVDAPDLSRVATFSGTVSSFTGGPGQGVPTVVLAAGQGEVAVVLSPYVVMLQAGYAPAAGAQVAVTAAPVTLDGTEHWVAITLNDLASGLSLQFRNSETGLPAVGGHGPWH